MIDDNPPRWAQVDGMVPYPCPDPGQEPFDDLTEAIRVQVESHCRRREEQIRELLGKWASELEATLFYQCDLGGPSTLLGVGYGPAGRPTIYVEDMGWPRKRRSTALSRS